MTSFSASVGILNNIILQKKKKKNLKWYDFLIGYKQYWQILTFKDRIWKKVITQQIVFMSYYGWSIVILSYCGVSGDSYHFWNYSV